MSRPRTKETDRTTARTALPATLRFDPISYRIDDAAAVVGVSEAKLQAVIAQGRLPTRKLDGCTLVLRADLLAFVEALPLGSGQRPAGDLPKCSDVGGR